MIRPLPYRPEIDGLRTVAVLPVILFHAGFPVFSGGFVGVDVFFVISGYLITTIILREVAAGDFSVLRFYERRARRILPALFVVVLACVPFAWFWMQPLQMRDFGRSVLTLALYGSNIQFWRESGYFGAAAILKPLLHTWSLSVEIQFYILFPLLLVALRGMPRRRLALVLAGLTLLSLGISEWGWRHERNANFYLLPSRVWELTTGALVALWLLELGPPRGRATGVVALAGLGAIGLAVGLLGKTTPFPGLWALLPVGGTAAVLLCAGPGTWAGRLLSLRPMVAVGLVSYSLYLWHQPVFAFARLRLLADPPPAVMAALALAVFPLAWLSWRLVEPPTRRLHGAGRRWLVAAAGGCTLAMLAAGWVAHATDGLPARLDQRVADLIPYTRQRVFLTKSCRSETEPGDGQGARCVLNPDLPGRIAVWGDSHGTVLLKALARELAPMGLGVVSLTRNGCLPADTLFVQDKDCTAHKAAALAYLEGPEAPHVVLLTGRWAKSVEGSYFDNGEGGRERQPQVSVAPEPPSRVEAAIRQSVARLRAAGHLVVVLGNIPEQGWNVPEAVLHREWFGSALPRPLSVSAEGFQARNHRTRDILSSLSADPGVIWLEPSRIFCDTDIRGRCIAERNGIPLYLDDDHVNAEGARLVAALVAETLGHLGLRP